MESIFILAALAIVLYLLLCPIFALLSARKAHAKIDELDQVIRNLNEFVNRLSSELKAAQFQQHKATTEVVREPVAVPELAAINPALPQQPESESLRAGATIDSLASTTHSLPEPQTQTLTKVDGESENDSPSAVSPDSWMDYVRAKQSRAHTEKSAPEWVNKLKSWLFGGNLVAKVGLLILFLGVSFLLKYAAARFSMPIEYRLVGIVLADIALLSWAWKIRKKRPGISLPVQGSAVAILMLVTFGAYKIYGLFPGGVAFALLFVLTAFTCLLAVLQDALWLAVFGIVGGFAAPILTTTGGGSHIGLFSYYAILNSGILAISLYRSWRLLNLIGFAFTFIIGTAWGVLRYTPEHYGSVQLFLILFFLFYVMITILYANRQAPNLKHYVDATLVFGTPLVAFGLQYGLVKHVEFGLAYSSLALGLFYSGVAVLLWRQRGTTLKLLTESFLALGVVFGTLTIPFALDGRWTSAAWALEGAGMVWVGLRQRQTMAWVFGLLVQFGAWMSFVGSVTGLDATSAMQSNLWLGFLLLAATAFMMAINFRKQTNELENSHPVNLAPFATGFLGLAAVWMLAGAWIEIALRTDDSLEANLLAMSGLLVAAMLGVISWQMQWKIARTFALGAQILAGLVFLCLSLGGFDSTQEPVPSLFAGSFLGALLIGLGAFVSSWFFFRLGELEYATLSNRLLMWSGFWCFVFVVREWSDWVQGQYRLAQGFEAYRSDDLYWSVYGLSVAGLAFGFALLAKRLSWNALRWFGLSAWFALGLSSFVMLADMYINDGMPERETWWAYFALWGVSEWFMAFWRKMDWSIDSLWLKTLHSQRIIVPWLMIWPVGRRLIEYWLGSDNLEEQALLSEAGWFTSGSWGRYLPAWLMMLAIFWVIRRARGEVWPTIPIATWYQRTLIPLGTAWSIILVLWWNLTQNGLMEPLPYLPVLNPLDLTTGFAVMLGIESYRYLCEGYAESEQRPDWLGKAPWIAALAGYAWFNLMLLRTVAAYLPIPYQIDPLYDSQFVQTMLSLVWSGTALVLMWVAAQRNLRKIWMLGALLLGIVVAKLFLVDLSNVGGLERVISFVGVGLLMLAIGYLAPLPSESVEAVDERPSAPPKI